LVGQHVERFTGNGGEKASNEFTRLQDDYYNSTIKLITGTKGSDPLLGHTEVKVDFTSSEMDGANNPSADGFVRIDIIVEHTPPEEDDEVRPALPAEPAEKDLVLEVEASKQSEAGTGGEVFVKFRLGDKWTAKQSFFKGCENGCKQSKKFAGMAAATQVEMSIISGDAFGYWRLTANHEKVLQDPKGKEGTPYGKCRYWIDGNQTADVKNVFKLSVSGLCLCPKRPMGFFARGMYILYCT
jgi:hypothetical protein